MTKHVFCFFNSRKHTIRAQFCIICTNCTFVPDYAAVLAYDNIDNANNVDNFNVQNYNSQVL